MHFGKSYDDLAVTFNLTFRIYFPNHGFLRGGNLRQVNVFKFPIKVVNLNLRLPLIISRITRNFGIGKIRNFLRREIITLIDLVLKYIDFRFLDLPDQILVNPACHREEFYWFTVLQYWFYANDAFYYYILAILYAELLGDCTNSHVLAVSDEYCAVAWSDECESIRASINVDVFKTAHDYKWSPFALIDEHIAWYCILACLSISIRDYKNLCIGELGVIIWHRLL